MTQIMKSIVEPYANKYVLCPDKKEYASMIKLKKKIIYNYSKLKLIMVRKAVKIANRSLINETIFYGND